MNRTRPIKKTDATKLLCYVKTNRERFAKWLTLPSNVITHGHAQDFIANIVEDPKEEFYVTIDDNNKIIAHVHAYDIQKWASADFPENRMKGAELAFGVNAGEEGTGVMKQSVKDAVCDLRKRLEVEYLVARCEPTNERSRRLILALRFKRDVRPVRPDPLRQGQECFISFLSE